MAGRLKNCELEGMSKEKVVAQFGALSRNMAGGTEETMRNISHYSRAEIWIQDLLNTKKNCSQLGRNDHWDVAYDKKKNQRGVSQDNEKSQEETRELHEWGK
jgi:hypothetical protein